MVKSKGDYIAVVVREGSTEFEIVNTSRKELHYKIPIYPGVEIYEFSRKYKTLDRLEIIGLISDLGGLAKITFASLFGIPKSEFNQWLIIKKL